LIRKLIFSFLLFANILSAQNNWDSTYYVKYNSRLIVALFQSFRQYDIELGQKIIKDTLARSGINYVAEANHISGIELNYDKINFSFGYKSVQPKNVAKTGNTEHFNIGMNIGGNKWILETAYRRYYGFYDRKTSNYDTTFANTGIYNQYPRLSSTSYKMKFLYFANAKRFSFKSGYSCTYRQIKSSASLILTANGYYNTFNTDSSLIPSALASYYDNHADFKGIDVAAFSVYGGASINIVLWRALFLNLTLLIGPEEQWRTYKYLSGNYNRTLFYQSWSGDFRLAYGLNFKRWFLTFNFTSDFTVFESGSTRMVSKYLSYSGNLGFRFRLKTPKVYQRFQQTKLYKLM
jgi:hypothetical protein